MVMALVLALVVPTLTSNSSFDSRPMQCSSGEPRPSAAHCGEQDIMVANSTPTPVWEPGAPLTHWPEREALAMAYRTLASRSFNAGSGLGSHLTMSVGPHYTNFLVVRYGVHWFEVTAENLVLVDNAGNILEGEGPVQGAAVALHGPVHLALKEKAVAIFHTHQPWFTSLACIKFGGLRMFHPEASIYDGRIGFDPVYTGNWPKGSKLGAMKEGERLMRNPHLAGKDIGFLGNHGTFQISSSVEEALFDCFNLERLAKLQAEHRRWGQGGVASSVSVLYDAIDSISARLTAVHRDHIARIAAYMAAYSSNSSNYSSLHRYRR